jgi:hypothetical protein
VAVRVVAVLILQIQQEGLEQRGRVMLAELEVTVLMPPQAVVAERCLLELRGMALLVCREMVAQEHLIHILALLLITQAVVAVAAIHLWAV